MEQNPLKLVALFSEHQNQDGRYAMKALEFVHTGNMALLFDDCDGPTDFLRSGAWKTLSASPVWDESIRRLSLFFMVGDFVHNKSRDRKVDIIEMLKEVGGTEIIPTLKFFLAKTKDERIRQRVYQTLTDLGNIDHIQQAAIEASRIPSSLADHEALFSRDTKLKMPVTTWLSPEILPPLFAKCESCFSINAVTFLLSKQSRHKTIAAALDVEPLLVLIDREKSAPFAAALVEGFLNSEQAASDRWALTLGGLLGDSRIIPPLLSRINDWCENSRCKLAEYAAQAISLLPGNEPLMVLDTLANRYRSKFKNVGKACAEAFNAAAAARGITTDELGDLVVPDFGFDCEGIRRFEWDGGGASAELGADFKLTWFDPETEKSWKALPANAPDEIKTEVKTLTKLLREAVKGQTARLEMTLVRQRRWAVTRWRELFENHALLRSFASNLVWGVYDGSGTLLRTFRRYPNGLLADAAGTLEDLPETDTMIGMVHPLELMGSPNEGRDRSPQRSGEWNAMENAHETSADSPMDNPSPTIRSDRPEVGPCLSPSEPALLDAWRAHLTRFKVKPPFPQIDRPVELLDPLHGNRREIALTKEKKLSAGTFRSRAEKRGWTRGSVVDAGGISSYYKLYPGAGVEVNLPTDGLYIGCDPMDNITLSAAYFVTAGTIERGSYMYNEPAPDDPRVLRFDQVPAVVYSETLSDLKAIIATNP